MTAPNELKKIHPLGKSPIISINAPHLSKPLVLAESAVIIEYLCTHFGGQRLLPPRYSEGKEGQVGGETEEWMRYQYFMHYTEGSLTPFLVMKVVMDSKYSVIMIAAYRSELPLTLPDQASGTRLSPSLSNPSPEWLLPRSKMAL